MKFIRYLIALVAILAIPVIAQQGGGGVPNGSPFSTQYRNGNFFGGTGPGTSGQVLTSRGAGLSPTFQAVSAGSVTSVGLAAPSIFTVTNSPVTTSGTLTLSYSGTPLPVLNGGTGTATPSLVAGTNISITGTWPNQTVNSTGGVTSVGLTMPGIFSVTGSPVTSSGTLAVAASGTSGGIPYFSSPTTLASSAAFTAHGVLIAGAPANPPVSTTAGTAGQVLTSNGASADPTFQAVPATSCTTGTFTGTLTGFTTTVQDTVTYRLCGDWVTLYTPNNFGNLTGTSNATTMTMTGLAAAVIPIGASAITQVYGVISRLRDNSVNTTGEVEIVGGSSTLTFKTCIVGGAALSCNGAFTASGTKGLSSGWTISYNRNTQ